MPNSTTPQFSAEFLAQDRGPTIIATNASFQGVACLVVLARLCSRFVLLRNIGLDDWTILFSTVLATANIVVAGQSVRLGTGRHKQVIPLKNVIPAGIYRFVTRVIYFLVSGTIKLSVCFLYLRIFPTIRKHVYVLIAFITASTIAQEFATIFQCVPVQGVWNVAKFPNATCINNVAFSYSASALSVVTDIWTLILPIPTVWSLQILTRKKVVLVGMFSLGMFACVAGIVRMAFLLTLLTSNDQPWDTYGTSIASGIEIALAIITASLPSLKPLVDRLAPKMFPSTRSRSTAKATDYELGSGRRGTHSGFVTIGSAADYPGGHGSDGESTQAIMVNQEYSVKVDSANDFH
ncbi:hypothetical protein LAWI1_G003018 [Lachnellula willkommii]|uniref:Rhodopsin domain-containing protein n=1 Tax=Lachnellula willkommii TaxID=215461 RepID=A0A559MFR5_9HELO|nr:hypothetical protein LAWI1_G003018 [Lachnellula willkommii]